MKHLITFAFIALALAGCASQGVTPKASGDRKAGAGYPVTDRAPTTPN